MRHILKLILPEINAREAAVVDEVSVYPGRSLMDDVPMLNTGKRVQPLKVDTHVLLDAAHQAQQFTVDVRGVRVLLQSLPRAATTC